MYGIFNNCGPLFAIDLLGQPWFGYVWDLSSLLLSLLPIKITFKLASYEACCLLSFLADRILSTQDAYDDVMCNCCLLSF
jgi:hypothetical protein